MGDGPASIVGGLEPGTQLGSYQIVRRLALGGMAELYLARHEAAAGFAKLVALKRVLPHLAEDDSFVKMFLNEAKLAATLVHPNIAQVTDFGSVGREYFMVMEFVHGRGVNELLRAASRAAGVPLECALAIVVNVAAALHHAHDATDADGTPLGLVHRDVSPSNILVSYDGAVKLVDFGIAKATSKAAQATRSGSIKGKLAYMSPEQARGADLDRTADVFSLGIVLYELTTGRRCFYAEGEFALLNKVAEAKFDRPSKVQEGFGADLEAVIMRALAADRSERYSDARELQRAVENVAADRGLPISTARLSDFVGELFGDHPYPTTTSLPTPQRAPTRPSPTRTTTTSARRRKAGWVGGGVLGVGVGLGVGLAVVWGGRDADVDPPETPSKKSVDAPDVAEAAPPARGAPVPAAAPGKPVEPDADPPSADEPEPVIEIEDAEPPSPKRGRRKRKKRDTKPRETKKAAPPSEFLPPSRRGG